MARPSDPVPRCYRTLLLTYPRAWRDRQAEVVLGTLLDTHAASGRSRPSFADRLWFAADGLRRRLHPAPTRPAPKPWAVPLGSMHLFDQTGGATAQQPISDLEQLRANRFEIRNSSERRIANMAWAGFNMLPHT